MKKQAGFTLIELIVGIAVMAIIFGGIVYIFGASSKSAMAGMNHKQAYESARTFMNEIKTTMRYADTINLDASSGTLTYAVTYNSTVDDAKQHPFYEEHFSKDISNGKACYYDYTITWKNSDKTQLKIVRNITPAGENGKSQDVANKKSTTFYFPTDDYVNANGAFKASEYINKLDSGAFKDFPVIEKSLTNSGTTVYGIAIPIQYKDATGTSKVDILQTEVQSTNYTAYDVDTSSETISKATTLLKATAAMYNSESSYINNSLTGKYYNYIVSGATSDSKIDTSRNYLNDFLQRHTINGYKGTLANLETHSWLIVPTIENNKVTQWTLYVAKNIIDDTDGVNQSYGTNYTGLTAALKKIAENDGKYLIRASSGFLCYKYTSSGNNVSSGTLDTDDNGNVIEYKGYVSGFRIGDGSGDNITTRAINPNSWVDTWGDNFVNLKYATAKTDISKVNTWIENHYDTNTNKTVKGNFQRLDYSQYDGKEFTKESCAKAGVKYEYPFGKTTYTANPT